MSVRALSEKLAHVGRCFWRLVRCVRALGLSKGVRYWRIENLCIAQPAFALQWADALESEALSHEANGVTQYAPSLRGFAADIRRHHAGFTANDAYQPRRKPLAVDAGSVAVENTREIPPNNA